MPDKDGFTPLNDDGFTPVNDDGFTPVNLGDPPQSNSLPLDARALNYQIPQPLPQDVNSAFTGSGLISPNAYANLANMAISIPQGFGKGLLQDAAGIAKLFGSTPKTPEEKQYVAATNTNGPGQAVGNFLEKGALADAGGWLGGALGNATAAGSTLAHAIGTGVGSAATAYGQTGGNPLAALIAGVLGGGGDAIGSNAQDIANALYKKAVSNNVKALNPAGKSAKAAAQKIGQEMTDRGTTALTRNGLKDKIAEGLEQAKENWNDVINDLLGREPQTVLGGSQPAYIESPAGEKVMRLPFQIQAQDNITSPVPTNPILQGLQAIRDRYVLSNGTPIDPSKVNEIDALSSLLQSNTGHIPLEDAQKIKNAADQWVSQSGGGHAIDAPRGSLKELHLALADLTRHAIAEQYPQLNAANKVYSYYRGAQDIMNGRDLADVGKGTGITHALARILGTQMGGPAGALAGDVAYRGANSTAFRTYGAKALSNASRALGKQNLAPRIKALASALQGASTSALQPTDEQQ